MILSFKKSLYLGLAAIAVVAAVGLTTTDASAKSYARTTSNQVMQTAPQNRNVTTNGTNALYTKAGTLRGARMIASKYTLQRYGSSKLSSQYFRAYRVATTNRGAVYYKVVSFNGVYRGWIYGGRVNGTFAGGLNPANTMANANLPLQKTGYTLTNPQKYTLWVDPKWSQYKAKQVDMSSYSANDTFTITDAAVKTREQYLYYKVTDDKNSAIVGWIYSGGVAAPNSQQATKDNSVKINYVNPAGQSVGAYTWIIQKTDLKAGATMTDGAKLGDILQNSTQLSDVATKNVPTGYKISATQSPTNQPANVTVGSEDYLVYVDPIKANFLSPVAYYLTNTGQQISPSQLVGNTYPILTDAQMTIFSSQTQGIVPAKVFDNALFADPNKLASLTGVSVKNADGTTTTPIYYFNKQATIAANTTARYGDTLKLYYTLPQR